MDDVEHLAEVRLVAPVLEGDEVPAGALGGGNHPVGVGDGEREGLLAHHVLAGFQGGDGVLGVVLVEGGHDDDFHLVVTDQVVERRVGAAAERCLRFLTARCEVVHHGDDAELIRQRLHGLDVNTPAAAPLPGDADAHWLRVARWLRSFHL